MALENKAKPPNTQYSQPPKEMPRLPESILKAFPEMAAWQAALDAWRREDLLATQRNFDFLNAQ